MSTFTNFYKCPSCKKTWEDVWSATCDDDCPHCGTRHVSPYYSDEHEHPSTCTCEDCRFWGN